MNSKSTEVQRFFDGGLRADLRNTVWDTWMVLKYLGNLKQFRMLAAAGTNRELNVIKQIP